MEEKLNELSDLFNDFSREYSKYLLHPDNFDELKAIVNQIESLLIEIIIETNFADAQKIVHDLAIQLPTPETKKGKFDTEELGKYLTGINEIITTAKPGAFMNVGYNVVALAPGSAILLCDFDTKNDKMDDATIESIEDTKKILFNVLQNSKSFSDPGYTPDKLHKFCEKTKLDEEKAYKISKTLSELFPDPNSKIEEIQLTINSNKKSYIREFKKDDRIKSIKTKQDIYQTIKPDEMENITGKLGIMEEWDENHKISIIEDDTFKIFTTNYEPSKNNLDIIKENIGKKVTIKRSKSSDDKRKWFLEEWVAHSKKKAK